MGNSPRFIESGRLHCSTIRTQHARFLLRPSPRVNTIIKGIIGRAQRRYGMAICYFVAMSNHLHVLTRPRDGEQLARFLNYVHANIAKEVGRLHGWKEKFWGRRYKVVAFTDEEEAQVAGLLYLLAHGCKEGLVRKPSEWPGASALQALLTGKPVLGHWFDRTAEYYARRAGEAPDPWDFAEEEQVHLTPLPCWDQLDPAEIQAKVRMMVSEVEQETRDRFESTGSSPLGARRVLRQNPHNRPAQPKRSPAPLVHAASLEAWTRFKEAWRDFQHRYRLAADRLLRNEPAVFPPGCFPPRGPFVPAMVRDGPI